MIDYCKQHLRAHKLEIRNTDFGKGLFAVQDGIVFRKHDRIIQYVGDEIGETELNKRYGNHTAPYAAHLRGKGVTARYIDSACYRGAGSYANHSDRPNAQLWVVDGRIYLFAIKNISNNQEIFLDYNIKRTHANTYLLNEANVTHVTK